MTKKNSNCDATIIDFRASIYGSLSPSSAILPDGEAQFTIKKGSRKSYIKAFDSLREYVGNDLEARPPTEQELLDYFNYLRLVKGLKSGSLWTTYSKINGLCKAKYSLNLKAFFRVTSLIRSLIKMTKCYLCKKSFDSRTKLYKHYAGHHFRVSHYTFLTQ